MIFLFPRWDMLVPWRVFFWKVKCIRSSVFKIDSQECFVEHRGGETSVCTGIVDRKCDPVAICQKAVDNVKGRGGATLWNLKGIWWGTWKKEIIYKIHIHTKGIYRYDYNYMSISRDWHKELHWLYIYWHFMGSVSVQSSNPGLRCDDDLGEYGEVDFIVEDYPCTVSQGDLAWQNGEETVMTRRILCDCVYLYVVVCILIYDNM